MEIILLIPKVIPEPRFNLIDADSLSREMTEKETIQLADYESRLANWNRFAAIVNAWPITGEYSDVVDHKKALLVMKDEEEYHLFSIPTERIDTGTIDIDQWFQEQINSEAWNLLENVFAARSSLPIKEYLKLMGLEVSAK